MAKVSRSNTRVYTKRVYNTLPRGGAAYSGYLRLDKTGGRCVYRSKVDRDVLLMAEFDFTVSSIERVDLSAAEKIYFDLPAMPDAVTFTLADGSEYTPDLRFRLTDGRVVYVETGYHSAKVENEEMSRRLAMARIAIEATGASFLVVTERIARGYRLENLRLMNGWRRPISDNEALRIAARDIFEGSSERVSVADVVARIRTAHAQVSLEDASEAARCVVARAEMAGQLRFDHLDRIDSSTKLGISATAESCGVSFVGALIEGTWTPYPELYVSPFAEPDADGVASSTSIEGMSEDQRNEFARRIATIRRKREEPMLTWAALAAEFDLSIGRVRHYWREYLRHGEAELAPGQRKATGMRVCDELKDTIITLYRNSRKFNARQIYDHPELHRRRDTLRAQGKRVDFTYDQLMRYLRPFKRDRLSKVMRDGKKRLPSRPASGIVDHVKQVVRPLQELQVDATPADVLCVTSDGRHVVRRAYIVYAVDVATRCFANVEVLMQEGTEADYLELIHGVMSPKGDLLKLIGSQIGDYPVYGIPGLILADRGWEFGSEGSRERLLELGVEMEHAAPYLPDMKGIVERAVQTANQLILHGLPGTTKSNPLDKGDRDAVAEALKYGLTFERLARFIKLGLIDGYADLVHSSLRMTPLEKWDRLVAAQGAPRRWPTDAAGRLGLKLFRLKREGARVRDHRGYEFANRFYRPSRKDAPKNAIVHYDPKDIRSIAIYNADGDQKGAFACEAVGTGFTDMSRPIPLWLDAEMNKPVPATRPRNGRRRLTEILAEAESGKRLRQRDATRYQQAVNAANAAPSAPSIGSNTSNAGSDAEAGADRAASLPSALQAALNDDEAPEYELPEYDSAAE